VEALTVVVTFTSKKALVADVSGFQQPDANQRYSRLLSKALNNRVECIPGAVLPRNRCGQGK
jgi:hypothetical protein